MGALRDKKGRFVNGHKQIGGFRIGHPYYVTEEGRRLTGKAVRVAWKNGKRKYHPNSGFRKGNKLSWKGGRYSVWRRECLRRDNYTCQVCGLKDSEIMQVDHIKPRSKYPELEWEYSNGRAICPNCHERKSLKEKSNKYEVAMQHE